MTVDAIALRPSIARQMKRAEDHVENWEMDRKVLINRLGFDRVVPMMIAGCCDDVTEESKREVDVGMDEDRHQIHKENIGVQGGF